MTAIRWKRIPGGSTYYSSNLRTRRGMRHFFQITRGSKSWVLRSHLILQAGEGSGTDREPFPSMAAARQRAQELLALPRCDLPQHSDTLAVARINAPDGEHQACAWCATTAHRKFSGPGVSLTYLNGEQDGRRSA